MAGVNYLNRKITQSGATELHNRDKDYGEGDDEQQEQLTLPAFMSPTVQKTAYRNDPIDQSNFWYHQMEDLGARDSGGRRFIGDIVENSTYGKHLDGEELSEFNTNNWQNPQDIDDAIIATQTDASRMGNALLNNVTIAGSTLVQGTAGFVWGVLNAAKDRQWNKIWNNDVNKSVQSWSDDITQHNYISRGKDYEEAGVFSKLGTTVFWADLVQNLGFTEGMAIQGMLTGNILGSAAGFAHGIIPSLSAAIGEASTEALNNYNEQRSAFMSQITNDFNKKYLAARSDEERRNLEEERDNQFRQVDYDLINQGNMVFGLNIALLTLTNNIEFGDLFSRGFKGTKFGGMMRNNYVNERVASNIVEGKTIGMNQNLIKKVGNWEAAGRTFGKGMLNGVSEAFEEGSQDLITAIPTYIRDYNHYKYSSLNPNKSEDYETAINDFYSAFYQAAQDTFDFNDPSKQVWTDMMTGFMTGLLGVPSISKNVLSNNIALDTYRAFKAQMDINKTIDQLNARFKDEKYFNAYRNTKRNMEMNDVLVQLAAADDKKGFLDVDFARTYSNMEALVSAGFADAHKALMGEMGTLTDEQIDEIRKDPKLKKTFTDANGGSLSNDEIRTKVKEKVTELDDMYKSMAKYNEMFSNLDQEVREELIYNLLSSENRDGRVKELTETLYDTMVKTFENYKTEKLDDAKRKEVEEKKAKFLSIPKEDAIKMLESIISNDALFSDYLHYSNTGDPLRISDAQKAYRTLVEQLYKKFFKDEMPTESKKIIHGFNPIHDWSKEEAEERKAFEDEWRAKHGQATERSSTSKSNAQQTSNTTNNEAQASSISNFRRASQNQNQPENAGGQSGTTQSSSGKVSRFRNVTQTQTPRNMTAEQAAGEAYTPMDEAKALQRLMRILPEALVKSVVIRDLIADGIWGTFYKAVIVLSRKAADGVEFHEAFHEIYKLFVDENTKKEISKYGYDEETLAEAFRRYALAREEGRHGYEVLDDLSEHRSLWYKIKSFFRILFTLGDHDDLDLVTDLFESIYDGKYGNYTPEQLEEILKKVYGEEVHLEGVYEDVDLYYYHIKDRHSIADEAVDILKGQESNEEQKPESSEEKKPESNESNNLSLDDFLDLLDFSATIPFAGKAPIYYVNDIFRLKYDKMYFDRRIKQILENPAAAKEKAEEAKKKSEEAEKEHEKNKEKAEKEAKIQKIIDKILASQSFEKAWNVLNDNLEEYPELTTILNIYGNKNKGTEKGERAKSLSSLKKLEGRVYAGLRKDFVDEHLEALSSVWRSLVDYIAKNGEEYEDGNLLDIVDAFSKTAENEDLIKGYEYSRLGEDIGTIMSYMGKSKQEEKKKKRREETEEPQEPQEPQGPQKTKGPKGPQEPQAPVGPQDPQEPEETPKTSSKKSVFSRMKGKLGNVGIKVHGAEEARAKLDELEKQDREDEAQMARAESSTSSVVNQEELDEIKAKAIANGTFMKAPNGRPTNLTEHQWLQVRTRAFKEWFGDWENDPENASKVVDENGEPLTVYHYSDSDPFYIFDLNRTGQESKYSKRYGKKAAFFLSEKDGNHPWGENETPVFLNIRKPGRSSIFAMDEVDKSIKNVDGYMPRRYEGHLLYGELVVFSPTQIKSATENNGEFSATNPDIRFMKADNGEILGFELDGEIYVLDETFGTYAHEYTHVWDKAVRKRRPELWKRGVQLMKRSKMWKQVEDSEQYGKKWKAQGKTGEELENLIASEVHARLVGPRAQELFDQCEEEEGKDFLDKLKEWLLDIWKSLAETFGTWTQDDLKRLTLEDFTNMTVRDLVNDTDINAEDKAEDDEDIKQKVEDSNRQDHEDDGNAVIIGPVMYDIKACKYTGDWTPLPLLSTAKKFITDIYKDLVSTVKSFIGNKARKKVAVEDSVKWLNDGNVSEGDEVAFVQFNDDNTSYPLGGRKRYRTYIVTRKRGSNDKWHIAGTLSKSGKYDNIAGFIDDQLSDQFDKDTKKGEGDAVFLKKNGKVVTTSVKKLTMGCLRTSREQHTLTQEIWDSFLADGGSFDPETVETLPSGALSVMFRRGTNERRVYFMPKHADYSAKFKRKLKDALKDVLSMYDGNEIDNINEINEAVRSNSIYNLISIRGFKVHLFKDTSGKLKWLVAKDSSSSKQGINASYVSVNGDISSSAEKLADAMMNHNMGVMIDKDKFKDALAEKSPFFLEDCNLYEMDGTFINTFFSFNPLDSDLNEVDGKVTRRGETRNIWGQYVRNFVVKYKDINKTINAYSNNGKTVFVDTSNNSEIKPDNNSELYDITSAIYYETRPGMETEKHMISIKGNQVEATYDKQNTRSSKTPHRYIRYEAPKTGHTVSYIIPFNRSINRNGKQQWNIVYHDHTSGEYVVIHPYWDDANSYNRNYDDIFNLVTQGYLGQLATFSINDNEEGNGGSTQDGEGKKTYKDLVKELIDDGFMDEGWYVINGREAVILNINGVKVPFYKSSEGTDGKIKGHWYPFFGLGIGKNTPSSAGTSDNNWLIKGNDEMENGYGLQELKDAMDTLNKQFPWEPRAMSRFNNHYVFGKSKNNLNMAVLGRDDSGVQNGTPNVQKHIDEFLERIKAGRKDGKSNGQKRVSVGTKQKVKPKKSNNGDDSVASSLGVRSKRRLRIATGVVEHPIDLEKEMAWLRKVLPNLSENDRIRIVKTLRRIGPEKQNLWGLFMKGMMVIAKDAAPGTVYHEAFHAVFHLLLDAQERTRLMEEARRMYPGVTDEEVEEKLAERFREYVTEREKTGLMASIVRFFDDLAFVIKNWLGLAPYADCVFRKIDNGGFAHAKPLSNASSRQVSKDTTIITTKNDKENSISLQRMSADLMHMTSSISLHKMSEKDRTEMLEELSAQVTVGSTLTVDSSMPLIECIELENLTKYGFVKVGYNKLGAPVFKKVNEDGVVPLRTVALHKDTHTKTSFSNLSEEDKLTVIASDITPEEFDVMPELLQHNLLNCL